MPVPVRDNGDPGPRKRLLALVHGFCSDHNTWTPLVDLLRRNQAINDQFDIVLADYATGPMAMPILRRLPTVVEIACYLDGWLKRTLYDHAGLNRYVDVTLVGHSMGGLAIQQLLTKMLADGRGREFDYIRQAIFFATPHLGSMTLEGLRGFLGNLVKNPQEELLRGLNAQVAQLHQEMETRILRASRRDTDRYPLPCTVFWGMQDNIVPEISARGFFPVAFALPGDHATVHGAGSEDALSQVVDAIAQPHGHPAIFEVDAFRYSARVLPLPPGSQRSVTHGHTTRIVESDNEAIVTREVIFSPNNSCSDDFELKYRTRNAGFIEPFVIPRIEMRPDHRSAYEEGGVAVNYRAPGAASRKYTLNMKVLRGFEAGHRDYHQHFTNQCYYRRVLFELDLTAYLREGWTVSAPPRLYYHPTDSDDHALCESRQWCTPDPATGFLAEGKWSWELEHINRGVLDIKWDVAK